MTNNKKLLTFVPEIIFAHRSINQTAGILSVQ